VAYVSVTLLEAVNRCLAAIGEEPVSSLASGLDEAETAESTVNEVNRDIQAKGWDCNTDEEYILTADVSDEYPVPANTLFIDTSGPDESVWVTVREGKLYNKTDMGYTFADNATLTCKIITQLDYEDLPYHLGNYIAARAAGIFQKRHEGSPVLAGFNSEEEKQAWMDLQDAESDADDANILYDCPTVNAIVYRNNRLYGRR
jgi:hypothetical protein